MTDETKRLIKKTILYVIGMLIMGSVLVLAWALIVVAYWYGQTFNLEFKELLYTMLSQRSCKQR